MPRLYSLDVHARELAAQGDDWHVSRMEWIETSKGKACRIDGVCCPEIKKGARKGRPNFKKDDKSTERHLVIFNDEHDAWCESYEKRTGICTGCMGDTKHRHDSPDGTCKRCGGSGKRDETIFSKGKS